MLELLSLTSLGKRTIAQNLDLANSNRITNSEMIREINKARNNILQDFVINHGTFEASQSLVEHREARGVEKKCEPTTV